MGSRPLRLALALAALAAATACAPKPRYRWNGYDDALYAHVKAPQDNEAYLEKLRQIVQEAEAEGGKVPPGLYAEYGYALFTQGQLEDAVVYYGKERDAWPESRIFMEKMIRNTRRLREARPASPRDGPRAPLPGELPAAAGAPGGPVPAPAANGARP